MKFETFILIVIVIIVIGFLIVSLINKDKEDLNCIEKDKFCAVKYNDGKNWVTIYESINECNELKREVKNGSNRWSLDTKNLRFVENITCKNSNECINYRREVELICNSPNKINMTTVSDIEPKCSNFLKVNITNYNETFSSSVDCEVSNCGIKEVKC